MCVCVSLHCVGDDDIDESERGVTCFYGHTGPVHAVSFSHDSRWLFSASGDGTVSVTHTHTHTLLTYTPKHANTHLSVQVRAHVHVYVCARVKERREICGVCVCVCVRVQVRAWSPELKHAICAYRGHLLPVWDVCAGPLGHHFVTGGADRTARVWSTDSVRMIRILAGKHTHAHTHAHAKTHWSLEPACRCVRVYVGGGAFTRRGAERRRVRVYVCVCVCVCVSQVTRQT